MEEAQRARSLSIVCRRGLLIILAGHPGDAWRLDLPRSFYRSFIEQVWVGLRRVMVLTHGAIPDGKFYQGSHGLFEQYFFDVLRFITIPPVLPHPGFVWALLSRVN